MLKIKAATALFITFGGFSSNHSRATVTAAREIGMEAHVMVLSPTPDQVAIIEDIIAKDGNGDSDL